MAEYELPWEYSFPPFFTLQRHEETKKRQIILWADIVLKYYKAIKKNKLSISNSSPIFSNAEIGRTLSSDLISQVVTSLQQTGQIHPVDKAGNEWNICWYTINEYADMMYTWASETGQLNAVCTLYEVSTAKPEFSEVDEGILIKALRKLEDRGKCEIFDMNGSYGVKFF